MKLKLLVLSLFLTFNIYSQSETTAQKAARLKLEYEHLQKLSKLEEETKSQGSNAVEIIDKLDEKVTKYGSMMKTIVEDLAKSLKVPAEHVYRVLAKQALVNSSAILFQLLVGVFLIILGIKSLIGLNGNENYLYRIYKYKPSRLGIIIKLFTGSKNSELIEALDKRKNKYKDGEQVSCFIATVVKCALGVVGIVAFINALFNLPEMFQGFLNPEYSAIQDIISMLK
jgi:hypothetical protein